MKEFQAFKDTLSNKTLKDIYEESKLEVQNETTRRYGSLLSCLGNPNGYKST